MAFLSHRVVTASRSVCMILCCAVLAGRTLSAEERAGSGPSDSILIEWSMASPRSSVEHVRLRVFSSGVIQAWPAGPGERLTEQRTAQDARELAESILHTVREHELTTESISRELGEQSKRTGLSHQIREADDSLISVEMGQGRRLIRCSATALLAERFPEAGRLQEFASIERRLGNLNCIVQCGGQDAARELCKQANEKLLSEHPKAAAWTIEDMTMVRRSSAGGRFVQFRRTESSTECWTSCITETPGFAARVSIIPPASPVR